MSNTNTSSPLNPAAIMPALLIFTLPLFFLTTTLNYFTTNKLLLIIIFTLFAVALTAYKHFSTKKHTHNPNSLTLPLILFWLVTLTNILLTKEAQTESLINHGILFLALPVLSYLIASAKDQAQQLKYSVMALIGTGTVLALHSILQLVVFADLAWLPIWMQSLSFTPTGSVLVTLVVLATSLAASLSWAVKETHLTLKTTLLAAAGIQLAAIISYLALIIPGQKMSIPLLPWKAGWPLALDSIKSGRELLIGVGLANFPVLFTNLKPAFLAQTDYWTTIFTSTSAEILQLLSTMGITGVLSFALIVWTTLKATIKLTPTPTQQALKISLYILVIAFVFLPANLITYALFFVLAAMAAGKQNQQNQSQATKEFSLPEYAHFVSAGVALILIITVGYYTARFYGAEVAMSHAQQAYAQNDAQGVYSAHTQAIKFAPTVADYRLSFAQINLQLASAISQTDQETELTDQQRQQITTLVQRATQQGQVATQLRPSYFATWQNLGNTYRNLINVVQDADQFALQSLEKAVALNPNDPTLRVEYGGLFYQLAQLIKNQKNEDPQAAAATIANLLTQATTQFQTAVGLRPTYANGYYNLSKTLEMQENYRGAYQALQLAMANIDPESADYQTAQKELLALEKLLPKTEAPTSETATTQTNNKPTLSQPEPLPEPLSGGPIDLQTEPTTAPENTENTESKKLETAATPEPTPSVEPVAE